jgi:hypothetical protein
VGKGGASLCELGAAASGGGRGRRRLAGVRTWPSISSSSSHISSSPRGPVFGSSVQRRSRVAPTSSVVGCAPAARKIRPGFGAARRPTGEGRVDNSAWAHESVALLFRPPILSAVTHFRICELITCWCRAFLHIPPWCYQVCYCLMGHLHYLQI